LALMVKLPVAAPRGGLTGAGLCLPQ
jgi:hypothetical protein